MIRIVADENIPHAPSAFSAIGQTVCLPGRHITTQHLAEANILVVRSVTKVNAALLKGTPVEFVGTTTIGFDHIDLEYLKSRKIAFVSAAGSNSRSVTEYIGTVLLFLSAKFQVPLSGKTLGVIGVGNIGRRVVTLAKSLGMKVLQNDPPRAAAEGHGEFCSLESVLKNADFITVHVPLHPEGPYRTVHLLDAEKLAGLNTHQFLINSSRGPVVDNAVLLDILQRKKLAAAVLDVWENEPDLNWELLRHVILGTPHIAGYSYEGKVNATKMIWKALCNQLRVSPEYNFSTQTPPLPLRDLTVGQDKGSLEEQLFRITRIFYDPLQDDRNLRGLLELPENKRGPAFDGLRKEYRTRREFTNVTLHLKTPGDPRWEILSALGFKLMHI